MAEGSFRKWMKEEVEPYLNKIRKYGFFQSYDGTSIFYNTYYLPKAESCIIIAHGFCEFAEKYNEVVYHFLKAGYSVYIPEHRGHGYSDRKTADTEKVHVKDYEEYVRDFAAFVEKIVMPRESHRILFAHSMGGAIGTIVLEWWPHMFEAAILSAPMFQMRTGNYPRPVADGVAAFYCMIGKGENYAAGQSGFLETPDFAGSGCLSEERYQYVYEKRLGNLQYRTYGGSYAWVHAGIKATRILRKKKNLRRIAVPILLFAAGKDHMVDNAAIEEFARHTSQTTLILLPEAKHEIFNAEEAVRQYYYEKIFTFLSEKKEEKTDERKNEQTGKILGYV